MRYKNITLWTDGGNHFKSQEFLHFQYNLSQHIKGYWKHNFFGEYHGKNLVDGHFGRLSQTFKEIELRNKINSIDQLLALSF